MITGMAHFGIGVENLDLCLAFYRDLLGLKVAMTYEAENGKMILLSPPGAETEGQYAVELLWFPKRRRLPEDHNAEEWTGIKHVALAVDDLEATYERLKGQGVKFLGELGPSPYAGVPRHINLLDPEGNRLELVERLK